MLSIIVTSIIPNVFSSLIVLSIRHTVVAVDRSTGSLYTCIFNVLTSFCRVQYADNFTFPVSALRMEVFPDDIIRISHELQMCLMCPQEIRMTFS